MWFRHPQIHFHGFLESQSAFNTREPRPSVVLGPYQQGFRVHPPMASDQMFVWN